MALPDMECITSHEHSVSFSGRQAPRDMRQLWAFKRWVRASHYLLHLHTHILRQLSSSTVGMIFIIPTATTILMTLIMYLIMYWTRPTFLTFLNRLKTRIYRYIERYRLLKRSIAGGGEGVNQTISKLLVNIGGWSLNESSYIILAIFL